VSGILAAQTIGGLLQEIAKLSKLSPDEVPDNCQFLLKVNFTELTTSYLETQQYWTVAMNAALTAQQLDQLQCTCLKCACQKVNRKIPNRKKLGVTAIEQQIQLDGMHQPPTANIADDSTHLNQTPLTSRIIK
jgi:hypothetical protein